MRLLILCAVFSVLLSVSLAGPVKTEIRDVNDSSYSSEESGENKNIEKSLSSREEEEKDNVEKEELIGNRIVKIKKEEEYNTFNSNEEVFKYKNLVKDEADDTSSSSSEEDDKVKDENLDLNKMTHKSKRSLNVDYISNSNNHLQVKDEGSIKYEKYLKLKRLIRELASIESNDSNDYRRRYVRNAETSEEHSSEEIKKKVTVENKDPVHAESSPKPEEKAAPARRRRNADSSEENSSEENKKAKPSVKAEKPDTAQAENKEPIPAESSPKPEEKAPARRRRDADSSEENSSEEEKTFKTETIESSKNTAKHNSDSSEENRDINEVFVFSNENHQNSEQNFKSKILLTHKYKVVLGENNSDKSLKNNKSSDEDYAQGCGNNDDNSSGNSNEDNETVDGIY